MEHKQSKITGADIRRLREALQMTQEEFAARVGVKTKGTISRLESGERRAKGPLLELLLLLQAGTNPRAKP